MTLSFEAPAFEAMVPLKVSGTHYDENLDRLRLLLDSFAVFLRLPQPLRIHAVCVPEEMPRIASALGATPSVEMVFHSEEALVPGIGAHRAIGWYKQQALKLAFGRICPAPFFLTLDPDVLLCRELYGTDLVRDGRCATSWMNKTEHPHWWSASAETLGMELRPDSAGLNVTPQMLSRDVTIALGQHLASRLGKNDPWLALLDVDRRWTEYTLYSVFAENSGLLSHYHDSQPVRGRQLLGRSVWTPQNFENYSLIDIHDDPAGAFFTVCASHTMVSASTIRTMFEALLQHVDHSARAA
jgi:hypothetical protein